MDIIIKRLGSPTVTHTSMLTRSTDFSQQDPALHDAATNSDLQAGMPSMSYDCDPFDQAKNLQVQCSSVNFSGLARSDNNGSPFSCMETNNSPSQSSLPICAAAVPAVAFTKRSSTAMMQKCPEVKGRACCKYGDIDDTAAATSITATSFQAVSTILEDSDDDISTNSCGWTRCSILQGDRPRAWQGRSLNLLPRLTRPGVSGKPKMPIGVSCNDKAPGCPKRVASTYNASSSTNFSPIVFKSAEACGSVIVEAAAKGPSNTIDRQHTEYGSCCRIRSDSGGFVAGSLVSQVLQLPLSPQQSPPQVVATPGTECRSTF